MNDEAWEARYRSRPRLFTGLPNPTLVAEAADLPAGRALDIGCGEGADAHWLAHRGWEVTAVDIAPTALERGGQLDPDVARRISWIESDITRDTLPRGPFELVTMHFIPLLIEDADWVLSGIAAALAAGGTLLFVTHDEADLVASGDADSARYCQPEDIAARLGPGWTITVQERRPRRRGSTGTRHTRDAILRAQRAG